MEQGVTMGFAGTESKSNVKLIRGGGGGESRLFAKVIFCNAALIKYSENDSFKNRTIVLLKHD